MGARKVPAPHLQEGEVSGSEVNASSGKRYNYNGHFLGDGTIFYSIDISDADGEPRGKMTGEFVYGTGANPRTHLEDLVRCALREGRGYRP